MSDFRFACPYCSDKAKRTQLGRQGATYFWECECGSALSVKWLETGGYDLHWFPPQKECHLKLVQ